ncbi:hypothetical protein KVT40_009381 [Elsinoe batatas]|uniref:Uncharacterized protein n=1 Tax=Elsinoe batatas TaxID=2601811 RepID=A0A8K0KVT1_9PEZI|nr:hypothetical protein KVT40_009381 [Elsinoe batatas]
MPTAEQDIRTVQPRFIPEDAGVLPGFGDQPSSVDKAEMEKDTEDQIIAAFINLLDCDATQQCFDDPLRQLVVRNPDPADSDASSETSSRSNNHKP